MRKDDLGDRMKRYEDVYNVKLPRKLPVIIRIDGKSFHTMVKKWACYKPFDENLSTAMRCVTKILCEEISGCELGYTQSDEISLLIRNDQSLETQPWFDNKLQKMVSISAAIATKEMNLYYKGALFDARAFILPPEEVVNYFIWRQQDAMRNSIQMFARSKVSHKKLQGVSCKDILLMAEIGEQYNTVPTRFKRGCCIVKQPELILSSKSTDPITRMKWKYDDNIPMFNEDRDYIERALS